MPIEWRFYASDEVRGRRLEGRFRTVFLLAGSPESFSCFPLFQYQKIKMDYRFSLLKRRSKRIISELGGKNDHHEQDESANPGMAFFNRDKRCRPGTDCTADAEHQTLAGEQGLQFLYIFPRDRYSEIEYCFSGV